MSNDNQVRMSEEAKQAQREYYRRWRATHKDAVRAKNRRYWEKRARLAREAAEQAKK